MNKEFLKKIIEFGIQAPSGDNSQPWKFFINKDFSISLYNIPDKDNPILNINQGGSYVSHGAVILNIKIVAASFGYKTNVEYFPDPLNNVFVSRISLVPNKDKNIFYEDLVDSIYKRNTNRRYYKNYLSSEQISNLFNEIKTENIKIKIFTEQKDKDLIADSISLSEEIILQTKELHELLFKDVMWTEKQEKKERHGLFVKTLEFNLIQLFVFWLCRKWKTISFLNKKINFSKIVGKQNSDIYKSSGLIGFIIIPSTDKINYVKAGEILQLIWLKSTKMKLGFQPITGLFFLNERIKKMGNYPINYENSKNILFNYSKLEKILSIKKKEVILTSFRIGESKKTSARSSRLKPNIILK